MCAVHRAKLEAYVVAGNCTNVADFPCSAVVMIDILVARTIPSGHDDVYLPNIGGYWSGHRGPIIDPVKARSLYRYVKDIPHLGVWSLDIPAATTKDILSKGRLDTNEVVVCYVHTWTSNHQSVRLWVDCALYYKVSLRG